MTFLQKFQLFKLKILMLQVLYNNINMKIILMISNETIITTEITELQTKYG